MFIFGIGFTVVGQSKGFSGTLTGNVIDGKEKPIEGSTVTLIKLGDSVIKCRTTTDHLGEFRLSNITREGHYSLVISYVGKTGYRLDSEIGRAHV